MPKPDTAAPDRAGYEKRDASAKWIFGIVLFLVIVGIAMHFSLAEMLSRLEKSPTPTDAWSGAQHEQRVALADSIRTQATFPRLQISPSEDLKALRAHEEQELMTYGWVNRTAGVVHIPIDRAMELLLERGLPTSNGTNGKIGRAH